MNIKKTLISFLIVSGLLLDGFFNLAFASASNPKNILEGTVFSVLTKQDITATKIEDAKIEKIKHSRATKFCRGVDKVKTTRKIVALTFDDGPDPKYTREILGILKQYDIHATFFVMGKNVESHPDIIKAAYMNGNVIGNHTYSHSYLTALSDDKIEDELTKTNKLIHDVIGEYPALFRPPYGARSVKSSCIVNKLGLMTITWSDTTNDYNEAKTTPEKIVAAIIKLAKPGAIILLHDGGGDREKTVQALPYIINILKEDDYEFLTVPELLNVDGYIKEAEPENSSPVK